jgi:DNA invertase Pin-like site-specific DNA recombinase
VPRFLAKSLIGYARVSTIDQNLALQRDALKPAGGRRIFADEGVSGSITARRGLQAALTALSPGDTLVVWKLDRLGRSLSHLVTVIAELGARAVNFRSLSDPIDTASSSGRLVMHIMGALAEFERGLIVERTQAAAKKRGVQLGRRPSLAPAQIAHARALIERGESPRVVARTMRVGKSTLSRALKDTDYPGAPTYLQLLGRR